MFVDGRRGQRFLLPPQPHVDFGMSDNGRKKMSGVGIELTSLFLTDQYANNDLSRTAEGMQRL